ncbi:MAG: NFACT RNA binding domain-containing protein [Candidatus Micrarchaeaceae archaeon]
MEIEIDFTKSAQDNANNYFNKSKKLLQKKEGSEKAIKDLEKKLSKMHTIEKKPDRKIIKSAKQEWYEKFHWFCTSNNLLAIGGRDAHQNELINSKHFDDNDLFFHADIFGASVVILKEGANAGNEIKEEVAAFAACYSSAWKEGMHSVDVYAMRRNQVSKSSSKGSLGTGSFLMTGEREWYRNVALSLVMFIKDDKLNTVPSVSYQKIGNDKLLHVKIAIGNFKKSDAAKKVSSKLSYSDMDTIMRQLPVGNFRIE